MSTSTTTPPAAGMAGPSTSLPAAPRLKVGDIALVALDATVSRPLLISAVAQVQILPTVFAPEGPREWRVSGVLFCQPEDHSTLALRGASDRAGDPARFHGRPDRLTPYVYAECLRLGTGLGEAHAR